MIPSLLVPFLKEVYSCFLRNASNDLESAYDHFFKQGSFPAKGVKESINGIDLGIKNLIVTSHNEKIKNIIKDRSKRVKGLQRALASRCKRES